MEFPAAALTLNIKGHNFNEIKQLFFHTQNYEKANDSPLPQMKVSSDGEEEDDDDDDFDEVPEKEGYEPHIPEHLRAEYGEFMYTNMCTSNLQTRAQTVRLSYKAAVLIS